MSEPTVIAIDWSGAKGEGRHKGIWLSSISSDGEKESHGWSRSAVIDHIIETPVPLVVGIDFSFGLPEWFACELGCTSIDDVWNCAAEHCDAWLSPNPSPPFWNERNDVPIEQRFRRCEKRYPHAKSVFQLVGAGMVGPGSVRGMPHLARLRASGFAVWPFDDPGDRTVVEIYPTVLRKHSPHHDVGPWISDDQRDAVVSARVMWDARETVAALSAATDPTIRLEGDIWAPTPPQSS